MALPKASAASYPVGDGQAGSVEVARAVRARLSDILTQTKRFIVLDREFGSEMQAEIEHINSGNVRVQDTARLGQQLATDLILIPTIERFEYVRSVRHLRMADRELVSWPCAPGPVPQALCPRPCARTYSGNSFWICSSVTGLPK